MNSNSDPAHLQEYFDKYRFEAQPQLLQEVATHLADLIPKDTEVLAGLEMGGMPIATALSIKTGLPTAFIRKKPNPTEQGNSPKVSVKNKKICLIEDVITTGGQVVESTQDLRNEGALVENVICVIYRGEGPAQKILDTGLNYYPLFTMEELVTADC